MQIKTKIVSSHTADYKPVKEEVNGTMILPPLVFPASYLAKFGVEMAQSRQGLGIQDPLGDIGGSGSHEQLLGHVDRVLEGFRG